MSWFLLAVVIAAVAVLARGWMRAFVAIPGIADRTRLWVPRLLRLALWLLVLGCLLRGTSELLQTALAQGAPVTAYTTGHPGRVDWLGLATMDGRYEIARGEGCDGLGPDVNVLLERSDDTSEATWTLQVPESDQVCTVAEWHWMGNEPCETNTAGVCDVVESRD